VALFAVALLIFTYLPNHIFATLQEKALGNLVTIFFGAISGLSIKEIQNKRDKILLLEFVVEEYEELDRTGILPESPERLAAENHCVLVIEKILGGS
jgi:hypothetical protein